MFEDCRSEKAVRSAVPAALLKLKKEEQPVNAL
jgi:hypothetical protein